MLPHRSLVILALALTPRASAAAQGILDVTTRASVGDAGQEGLGDSSTPATSQDGRWIAFTSLAENLVFGDANGKSDVFVRDTLTGAIELVSRSAAGEQGNHDSSQPFLSADGRFVAFRSSASNLVPGDVNGVTDAFLHDRLSGTTSLVSVSSAGVQGNSLTFVVHLSPDGRWVVLWSASSNLVPGDTNGFPDYFLHDTASGTIERINVDSQGQQALTHIYIGGSSWIPPALNGASVSADGRYVVFCTNSPDLDAVETSADYDSDLFLRDVVLGTTTRLSVGPLDPNPFGNCFDPAITPDGRWVVFISDKEELFDPPTQNPYSDVCLLDLQSGVIELVSRDSYGVETTYCEECSISDDGRYVAFTSPSATLVPGTWSPYLNRVYVRDRFRGVTDLPGLSSMGEAPTFASCSAPVLSGDGRILYFATWADNLVPGDTNGRFDVFRHDRMSGGPELEVLGLAGGALATVRITGATASGAVALGWSLSGQGIVPSAWGLLDLAPPIFVLLLPTDGSGLAQFSVPVPAALSGTPLWLQGIDIQQSFPTSTFGALIP